MKRAAFHRKVYVRPRSRNNRHGLGYDRHAALWRFQEERLDRYAERANDLLAHGWHRFLWETDPQVFYRSPFLPRPHYDPERWLPRRQG